MKQHSLLSPFLVCLCLPLTGAVTVVEDFESAALDDDIGTLSGWTENTDPNLLMDIKADPADASNKVLRVQLPSGTIDNSDAGAWKSLGSSLGTGSTAATLFYQMRFENTGARAFAGFSAASTGDLAASTNFGQTAAYAGGITSGGGFGSRDAGTTESAGSPSLDTWYNVWLVVDNSTRRYDVYINSGTGGASVGDLLFSGQDFRTGADGIPGPLDKLVVLGTNNSADAAYFDSFVLDDTAANLNYQLVPEPSTYALFFGTFAGLLILLRRCRN